MLRAHLKNALETSLVVARAHLLAAQRLRRRVLVLAYHNIVADRSEAGADTSLHLPASDFAAQLDLLLECREVVGLMQALRGEGEGRRPLAVITFDDAYRGALENGVPLLAERGLPATLFVTPGVLGGRALWWDVWRSIAGEGLAVGFRLRALREGRGRSDEVSLLARREGLVEAAVPPQSRTATEAALSTALAQHPGLTLGSHSWSHPVLPTCTPAELREELERPLSWLQQRFAGVLPWISYPYGLSSPEVQAAAARAGYAGGLLVEGGHVRAGTDGFQLPRLNIPAGVTANGFRLRVSGVLRG